MIDRHRVFVSVNFVTGRATVNGPPELGILPGVEPVDSHPRQQLWSRTFATAADARHFLTEHFDGEFARAEVRKAQNNASRARRRRSAE